MEVWTFIKNNQIIKFDIMCYDIEFGSIYYFVDPEEYEYSPIWFVNTKEEAELAYQDFVHPQFSINHKRPSTDKINIKDYKIVKFKLS
jgi:hypothetical protein